MTQSAQKRRLRAYRRAEILKQAIISMAALLGIFAALDQFSPRIIARWQEPVLTLVMTHLDLVQVIVASLLGLSAIGWLIVRYAPGDSLHHFVIRNAAPHELSEAVHFAEQVLSTGVTPPDRTLEWVAKNPGVYRLAFDSPIGSDETRLVGYYVALPLSRSATDRILRGEARIADIRGTDILAPATRKWASLYVGGVAGITPKSRAFIQKELEKMVLFDAPKRTRLVLARPVTAKGLTIARQFGFKKASSAECGDLGNIFRLDLGKAAAASSETG